MLARNLAALALTTIALVELHGPGGQQIWVNPAEVVSVREPRNVAQGHFAPHTHCLLLTVDGGFIAVAEPCDEVRRELESAK